MARLILSSFLLAAPISAHIAAWTPGMYCRGGNDSSKDDPNTSLAADPLYQLPKDDWWFQHDRGCDKAPPPEGESLAIPANGEFTVELAHNRNLTSLSYNGTYETSWPDGLTHPNDWNGWGSEPQCLDNTTLHTYNETSAGGTAFAISYQPKLENVTIENLVVFSTLQHTPWKRVATYQVPDLPGCPEGGCHCAWLWVPNGCGKPSMYMQGFRCHVTNVTSICPVAEAQAPIYCADDPSKCVKGAKQMIAWQQGTENNIETEDGVTPNYNTKCGWENGAQHDIFETWATNSYSPVPVEVSVYPSGSTPLSTAVTESTSTSLAAAAGFQPSSTSTASAVNPPSHCQVMGTCSGENKDPLAPTSKP